MGAEVMRRARLRYMIVVALASVIPLAGLIWSLTVGRRNTIIEPRRVEEDVPTGADLTTRLQRYRTQIKELARKESWALVEADNLAENLTKNRRQADHVRTYLVPAHVEYYAQEAERSLEAAAASRERAASFGRQKRELEGAFYRLWATVPPDRWGSLHLAPSDIP